MPPSSPKWEFHASAVPPPARPRSPFGLCSWRRLRPAEIPGCSSSFVGYSCCTPSVMGHWGTSSTPFSFSPKGFHSLCDFSEDPQDTHITVSGLPVQQAPNACPVRPSTLQTLLCVIG